MSPADEVKKTFGEILDRHGYGFQYSVLTRAIELQSQGSSQWVHEVSEFPVAVQGTGTRIDFILRSAQDNSYLLIAECKRADPKFSHWCFIRAPFVRRGRTSEHFFADHVIWQPYGDVEISLGRLSWPIAERAYHIGLAIKKANVAGESTISEQDAIEKTSTQVCRGVNGLIETIAMKPRLLTEKKPPLYEGTLIPVIFTTAKLYTCEYDLSKADIQTGHCNISDADFSETPWLFFQYHLSPGIKYNGIPDRFAPTTITDWLDEEYIRTIPIVSANSVGPFLSEFKPWL